MTASGFYTAEIRNRASGLDPRQHPRRAQRRAVAHRVRGGARVGRYGVDIKGRGLVLPSSRQAGQALRVDEIGKDGMLLEAFLRQGSSPSRF